MYEKIEVEQPISLELHFQSGEPRAIRYAKFGGLHWDSNGSAAFQVWYDDGTSENFALGDVVAMRRADAD